MVKQFGFYQPDLRIEYNCYENMPIHPSYIPTIKGYFQLVYLIDGNFKVKTQNDSFTISKNKIIIANSNNFFYFKRESTNAATLTFYFHESIFKNIKEENIFLPFRKLPCGAVFDLDTFNNKICFEILNSFPQSLIGHYNRFFMITKLQCILAELMLDYNTNFDLEKHDKENLNIDVIDYIENNFKSELSYEILKNKFFLSNNALNSIIKNYNEMTLNNYVNHLRLENAKDLLKNKLNSFISISKIAEMSGFKTYSTFYREYLKKYGVPPSKDL